MTKEVFKRERKNCKSTLQREKRKFFSNLLQIAENDHTQGRTRNFFRVIKQFKQFNPIWNAISDQDGQMLMELELRAERWKGYFEKLLNGMMPAQPVMHTKYEKAETHVEDVSLEEVKIAIFGLKNWKAPGTDNIPAKLIKYGGEELHVVIYRLCQLIWVEERIPDSWNEAIIIPLHKKGDKIKCDNYRGISLLNSAYKVFSRVLLNRIVPYAEDCLGDYQCSFRKGRSTTEQLSIIGQIIEKRYEYRQNIWQLFIDFKKAYDSIHRESLYNIMYKFGFPKQLIALTKMCMENTKYRMRTQNVTSGTFTVETGLKQGDVQSPVLFNLALKKVVRILQDNEGGLLIVQNKIRHLSSADDLDTIGNSLTDKANAARVLEEAVKKIGLEINTEKKR